MCFQKVFEHGKAGNYSLFALERQLRHDYSPMPGRAAPGRPRTIASGATLVHTTARARSKWSDTGHGMAHNGLFRTAGRPPPTPLTASIMTAKHKNKTLATLFAFVLGGLGAHRFYLYGKKDTWAWAHLFLFPLAVYAGFIEALVIGLTPDEKWDATYNRDSGQQSESGWPLAVLLVLTVGLGAFAVIATIARVVDYLYTGGAYG
jgi:TM2 domain-containing membrane protein YozV